VQHLLIRGDVRETLASLLRNPQTIVRWTYTLDLYGPTVDTLPRRHDYWNEERRPLTVDQIGHAKWPGRDAALREVIGPGRNAQSSTGRNAVYCVGQRDRA